MLVFICCWLAGLLAGWFMHDKASNFSSVHNNKQNNKNHAEVALTAWRFVFALNLRKLVSPSSSSTSLLSQLCELVVVFFLSVFLQNQVSHQLFEAVSAACCCFALAI